MKYLTPIFALVLGAAALPAHADFRDQRIDQRQAEQAYWINQGLNSGQLTQHEANNLYRDQQRIQSYENRARADGRISEREWRRLNSAQQRENMDIYRARHDGQFDYNHDGRNDRRQYDRHHGNGHAYGYQHGRDHRDWGRRDRGRDYYSHNGNRWHDGFRNTRGDYYRYQRPHGYYR